jgi:hypothetical protein
MKMNLLVLFNGIVFCNLVEAIIMLNPLTVVELFYTVVKMHQVIEYI